MAPNNGSDKSFPARPRAYTYSLLGGSTSVISSISWSPDGSRIAASSAAGVTAWDVPTGDIVFEIELETDVLSSCWSPNGKHIAVSTGDSIVRLYDGVTGREQRQLQAAAIDPGALLTRRQRAARTHVRAISWSPDSSRIACCADAGVQILEIESKIPSQVFMQSAHEFKAVAWSPNGNWIAAAEADVDLTIFDVTRREAIWRARVESGGSRAISAAAISWRPDSQIAATSSGRTVAIWDIANRRLVRILEGHTKDVGSVSFSPTGDLLASREIGIQAGKTGRFQRTIVWNTENWDQIGRIIRPISSAFSVALGFSPNGQLLAIADVDGTLVHITEVAKYPKFLVGGQIHYKNAKIALLGDSGVGKSGLGLVLSGRPFAPTDSTHGRQIWQIEQVRASVEDRRREIREIVLWDLAGQPGYRLIHQLHLDDVSIGLLLFDARSELDPFAGVRHWHRALLQAAKSNSSLGGAHQILVAARTDRGSVPVSQARIRTLMDQLGIDDYVVTSARDGVGVTELQRLMRSRIEWNSLPTVSSTSLLQSIRRFVLDRKRAGVILTTLGL